MSAITTPNGDLILRPKAADEAVASPFTTFAAGHFVRPAATAQPVAPAFTFGLCDVFVAEPLDLDYEEPNAVCEGDLELVAAGDAVHHVELAAPDRAARQTAPTGAEPARSAA